MEDLKQLIREVPDFPKPGILFYDITTLIKDPCGFRGVIDGLKEHYREAKVDVVLGVEARGFIFAPALAYALGAGFVPVRKPGKLPAECVSVSYALEYGTDTLEMHSDAVKPGQSVLIKVDTYPGKVFTGKVDSIMAGTGAAFSLFPPENALGNYVKVVQRIPVKIVFDNNTDAEHVLRIGMSCVPTIIIKNE